MKTSEILMLTLLRNMVVKKEAITDVVTQETLSDLLTLSAKHSITPLVAEGLFSCGLLKEEDIAEVYRQLSYKALVRGQKQELELCKITDFFEKNHIDIKFIDCLISELFHFVFRHFYESF